MGSRRSLDTVKSFCFSGLPLKAEDQLEHLDGWSSAVEAWLAGSNTGDGVAPGTDSTISASQYLHELTVAREKLLGLLQHTSSSPAEVAAAQSTYLALLVEAGAVEQQAQAQVQQACSSSAVLRSTWFDALLPLAAFSNNNKANSGSTTFSTTSGTAGAGTGSKWFGASSRKKQAAAAAAAALAATAAQDTSPPQASGYAWELANILLSVATWKVARAGCVIMAPGGADSDAAMEAYQLYCQAAGVLDDLRRRLLPQLDVSQSGDLQREVLSALHLFALGEAQNIMLQRGVALKYQGSTLAPMATDTAMLFSQTYEALEAAARSLHLPWNFLPPPPPANPAANNDSDGSSSSSSSNAPAKNPRMAGFERLLSAQLPDCWPEEAVPLLQLAAYVQYQVGHCYCLAAICGAEMALSNNQAGQAVALAQLGTHLCGVLQDTGFEQSALIDPCSTLGMRDSSRRLGLQASLEQKAGYVLRKCLRENRTIYFQYVPEQPSALPWPARSAQPEVFKLPSPKSRLTSAAARNLATATALGRNISSSFTGQTNPSIPGAAGAAAAAGIARVAGGADAVTPAATTITALNPLALKAAALKSAAPIEPNSLALLAQETVSFAAAAKAAAAAGVQLSVLSRGSSATQELLAQHSSNSSSSSDEEGPASHEAADGSDAASVQQASAAKATAAAGEEEVSADADAGVLDVSDAEPLLLEASFVADTSATVTSKSKQVMLMATGDAESAEEVTPAAASYTLTSVQDVAASSPNNDSTTGSTNSRRESSSSAGSSSNSSSRRRRSSSSSASGDSSSRRRSSASGASSSRRSSWGGIYESSEGSLAEEEQGSGFFSRLLGCCVRPECDDWSSVDEEDESHYDESEEGCEEHWKSCSDPGQTDQKQQGVVSDQQQYAV